MTSENPNDEVAAKVAIVDGSDPSESGAIRGEIWRGWRGSNPRPLASEANTLSTELQPRNRKTGKDTGFQPGSP